MSCISCENCVCTKCLPVCIDELQIGRIPLQQNVTVFFEEVATGRIDSYDAQSNAALIVKLDTTNIEFKRGHEYILWITDRSPDNNINDNIQITITNQNGDIASDCLLIEFKEVYDDTALKNFTSHKIELCDDVT